MKKKILFIINPISGVGRQRLVEKLVTDKIDASLFDFEFAYTKAHKHAIALSKQGVKEGFNIITAVGGDGSVNEVGQSLIGSATTLAILPCGSGNGAARHLEIPMNLVKAIELINKGKTSLIDTFKINAEIAINTAGIGYAAYIAHQFSKLKSRGFSNYIKIAIRDSVKYKPQMCELEFNGTTKKINAFIVDIANGAQWGNNAVISPNAKNNDGLLDLCIVEKFPFLNFPILATRLFTNSIHKSKFVEIHNSTNIKIIQEENYAHIDGEPIIIGNELNISINPSSLKVIVP